MTCTFPMVAVTARTAAAVSEPDRSKSDRLLKAMTRAFPSQNSPKRQGGGGHGCKTEEVNDRVKDQFLLLV